MRFLKNNNLISKYKQGFDEYKKDVNCRINSEVYNEITSIENRVKARANVYKMTDIQNTEDKLKRLIDAENKKESTFLDLKSLKSSSIVATLIMNQSQTTFLR